MGSPAVNPEFRSPLKSPLADEEVVARVLAGDTALYEVIMRRYNQRLFRITRAILLNDDEAEDVIQDAYLRAYGALDQFAGRAKFSTWLTKIAIYEALNRLRKRKREQEFPDSPDQPNQGIESVKSSEPDPEQQALRYEAATFLEQAVDALPDIYRSVFVLREIETLSTAETASCLDRAGCNARSSGKGSLEAMGTYLGIGGSVARKGVQTESETRTPPLSHGEKGDDSAQSR